MGGGEYERANSFAIAGPANVAVAEQGGSLQSALDSVTGGGIVEIGDSGRYEETPDDHG